MAEGADRNAARKETNTNVKSTFIENIFIQGILPVSVAIFYNPT